MRSIRSIFAEQLLAFAKREDLFFKGKEYEEILEANREINSHPYKMPKIYEKSCLYGKINDVETYIFSSKKNSEKLTIIYLHGGAYTSQPLVFHWQFIRRLTKEINCRVIVPIYPKTPNYKCQEVLDIMVEFYKKVLENNDPERIVFMGDSAGGGLCVSLAMYLKEKNITLPKHIFTLSPWLDLSMSNPLIKVYQKSEPMLETKYLEVVGKTYADDLGTKNYLVSPLYGDMKGMPPMTLFIGTHEILFPDTQLFRLGAAKENVEMNYFEYQKMNHVFPLFPIPEAKNALRKIKKIVKKSINIKEKS